MSEALSSDLSQNDIDNLQFKHSREWDSISHIRLMTCLRSKLNINFTFEEMIRMTKFDEILKVVLAKKNEGVSG